MTLELSDYAPLWWLLACVVAACALVGSLVTRSMRQRVVATALRVTAIALIVLALCRPTTHAQTDRLHVVFLIDVSASVELSSALRSLDDVDAAIERLDERDSWTLALIGDGVRGIASTQQARDLLNSWLDGAPDDAFRSGTSLASAMRSAALALPADASARLVVFTDAKPTDAELLSGAIADLRDDGAEFLLSPLDSHRDPEVGVVSLRPSPAFAHEGQTVRLTAAIRSNVTSDAAVRLVHRGVIVEEQSLEINADEQTEVVFQVPMVTTGATRWTVEIDTPADRYAINNAATCTIDVSGKPRVLVIHERPREMRDFARAMAEQQITIDTRPPSGVPQRMEEALAFDAIVLAQVPATELTPENMQILRRYVSEFGGGLAMLGSEESFGLGGYHRTPVEEALPLVSRFEKEKEKPSLAMALVIDKSGSMQGAPIALAKQAAKATVELLGDRDQIAVIGFDSNAFVASEMRSATEASSIRSAIDRIGAGGGTFMYAGMSQAAEMLRDTSAQIKHMIVLGDGMTGQADHDGLVRQLVDNGVTVSTVALGAGADRALLSRIASDGRGRYYEAANASSVPQIFTKETMEASRSAIKEDYVGSVRLAEHPMFAGFENAALPFSLGYVMTRAKPTTRVLLSTETGDPLLATSAYGLGTTLAFTSDLTAKWGADWLQWGGFEAFWSQAMRSIVRRPDASNIRVEHTLEQDSVTLSLWDESLAARAGEDAQWIAGVSRNGGPPEDTTLERIGLARFQTGFRLQTQERVTVRLHEPTRGLVRVIHLERPYPPEYDLSLQSNKELNDAAVFDAERIREDVQSRGSAVELTHWFLIASLVCMIAGVAARRL